MKPIIDKWTNVESILTTHENFIYGEAGDVSLGQKSLSAIKAIYQAIADGWTCQVNVSFGKDSACTLHLFLMALMLALRNGVNVSQKHFILHADTGVENPEVHYLARKNIQQLNAFIEANQLPLTMIVATPSFTQSWVGRILTGRGLPTFPGAAARQCTHELKISGANRARAKHMKLLSKAERQKVCLILGSRDDEGTHRAASIARFGGQSQQVTITKDGGALYPIKEWTTENVWEFLLSTGTNKPLPSYGPSMTATAELYKSSTGECIWSSADQKQSSGCGSRHGCFTCQAGGDDKSMTNMLKASERYDYMKPLHRIQQLIAKTRYDWSKRSPVGRTIYEGGFIRWQPDVYSPEFTEKLLRACISADYMEAARAQDMLEALESGRVEDNDYNRRMAQPQFRIVSDEQIIMVDFVWSLHNYQSIPFRALEIYHDVWRNGLIDDLSEVDDMEPVERTPMPAAKWVYVGADWFPHPDHGGLVDHFTALTQFDTGFGTWTKPVKTSHGVRELIAANEEAEFNIDMEAAYFTLNYDYERLIEQARSGMWTPAAAAHYYLRTGIISIAKGKVAMYDTMAARGQRYRQLGICGQQSHSAPPAHLRVLTNAQYKRRVERIKIASIKRFKWWAFMGWFTQAHLTAQTFLGGQLKRQLSAESGARQKTEVAHKSANYRDTAFNALNTLCLVKSGHLEQENGFVQRQLGALDAVVQSDIRIAQYLAELLARLREAITSNAGILNAPSGVQALYESKPTDVVMITDALLARIGRCGWNLNEEPARATG